MVVVLQLQQFRVKDEHVPLRLHRRAELSTSKVARQCKGITGRVLVQGILPVLCPLVDRRGRGANGAKVVLKVQDLLEPFHEHVLGAGDHRTVLVDLRVRVLVVLAPHQRAYEMKERVPRLYRSVLLVLVRRLEGLSLLRTVLGNHRLNDAAKADGAVLWNNVDEADGKRDVRALLDLVRVLPWDHLKDDRRLVLGIERRRCIELLARDTAVGQVPLLRFNILFTVQIVNADVWKVRRLVVGVQAETPAFVPAKGAGVRQRQRRVDGQLVQERDSVVVVGPAPARPPTALAEVVDGPRSLSHLLVIDAYVSARLGNEPATDFKTERKQLELSCHCYVTLSPATEILMSRIEGIDGIVTAKRVDLLAGDAIVLLFRRKGTNGLALLVRKGAVEGIRFEITTEGRILRRVVHALNINRIRNSSIDAIICVDDWLRGTFVRHGSLRISRSGVI